MKMKKLLLTALFLIGCGGSSSEKEIEIIEPEIKTSKLCLIFNNPAKDAYNMMKAHVYPNGVNLKYNEIYQQHANLIEIEIGENAYIDFVLGWNTKIDYLEVEMVKGDHITFITFYPGMDHLRNDYVNYSIEESTEKKCENKPF
jgi:hypothetical protein